MSTSALNEVVKNKINFVTLYSAGGNAYIIRTQRELLRQSIYKE